MALRGLLVPRPPESVASWQLPPPCGLGSASASVTGAPRGPGTGPGRDPTDEPGQDRWRRILQAEGLQDDDGEGGGCGARAALARCAELATLLERTAKELSAEVGRAGGLGDDELARVVCGQLWPSLLTTGSTREGAPPAPVALDAADELNLQSAEACKRRSVEFVETMEEREDPKPPADLLSEAATRAAVELRCPSGSEGSGDKWLPIHGLSTRDLKDIPSARGSEAGAELEARVQEMQEDIFNPIMTSKWAYIRSSIKKASLKKNNTSNDILWDALSKEDCHYDRITEILKSGRFDMNAPLNPRLCFPPALFYTISHKRSPGIVKLLISYHADVRQTWKSKTPWENVQPGMTPLEAARSMRVVYADEKDSRLEAIEALLINELARLEEVKAAASDSLAAVAESAGAPSAAAREVLAPVPAPVRSMTWNAQKVNALTTVMAAQDEDEDEEYDYDTDEQEKSPDSGSAVDNAARRRHSHIGPDSSRWRHSWCPLSEKQLAESAAMFHDHALFACKHADKGPESVYILDEQVGCGTFGSVSRAHHRKTGQEHAVKTMPKHLISVDTLLSEIDIMRQLDHPHIIRLYQTFQDQNSIHYSCEMCTGGQLFDALVKAGHLCEGTAARVMKQMLAAVNYLHFKKICHRDLKPENFLLAAAQELDHAHVKLIDFGTAKRFDLHEMTTKVCTVFFVAPEILARRMQPYDEKCDVWSLGVILFIMLSGVPPFSHNDDFEVLKLVKKGKFAFEPSSIWDMISEDAHELIKHMLCMKVRDRFSARDVIQDVWCQEMAPNSKAGLNLNGQNVLNRMRHFTATNKLKKAALQVIARQVSDDSIEDLRNVFIELDADQSGSLTIAQMEEGLLRIDVNSGYRKEMHSILTEMEVGGMINYTQFVAATIQKRHYLKEEVLKAAFHFFDVDSDGVISREDLTVLLADEEKSHANTSAIVGIDLKDIEKVMKEVDSDGSGGIDYQEFAEMMGARPLPIDRISQNCLQSSDGVCPARQASRTNSSVIASLVEVFEAEAASARSRSWSYAASPESTQDLSKRLAANVINEEEDETQQPAVLGQAIADTSLSKGKRMSVGTRPCPGRQSLLLPHANTVGLQPSSQEMSISVPPTIGDSRKSSIISECPSEVTQTDTVAQQTLAKAAGAVAAAGAAANRCKTMMIRTRTVVIQKQAPPGSVVPDADAVDDGPTVCSMVEEEGREHEEDERREHPLFDALTGQSIDVQKVRYKLAAAGEGCLQLCLDAKRGIPEPLFFAASLKSLELVNLLVTCRADVQRRFRGQKSWKGVKPGQTPLQAVRSWKGKCQGTALHWRLEDIEARLKKEVDRIRGWNSGVRALQAVCPSRYANVDIPAEPGVVDIFEEERLLRELVPPEMQVDPNAVEAMGRKTLYRAAASLVCAHVDGHPTDRYEIGAAIGEGTFGTVLKVKDNITGMPRAMKRVAKSLLEGSGFWREIELMREIDHPNIMRLYMTFEDDEDIYMVLEYCSGGELFDAIESAEGGFSELAAANLIRQMLIAVCYLHNQQICHRDLKPENFLLATVSSIEEAHLKLIDFGTARKFGDGLEMTTKICTLHYVAPEILSTKHGAYTHRCDVWSLGVILFLMLSGQPPFYGVSDTDILKKVKKGRFKFEPRDCWDEVSDGARALVSRLLVVKPDERISLEDAIRDEWTVQTVRDTAVQASRKGVERSLGKFWSHGKFKRLAMQVAAQQLVDMSDNISNVQATWIALDGEHTGRLRASDLGVDESVLLERGDEAVYYTQFLAASLDKSRALTEEVCRAAFCVFDLDNDGLITPADIALIMLGAGCEFDPSADPSVREALASSGSGAAAAAAHRDRGAITFESFVSMLTRSS